MDNTIRNVSELEKALQNLTTDQPDNTGNNPTNQTSTNQQSTNYDSYLSTSNSPTASQVLDSNYLHQTSTSKSRLGSANYGTNSLLHNLCGYQNSTNNKLDALLDSSMRTQQLLDTLLKQQTKQIELLAMIARNTASNGNVVLGSPSNFEQISSTKGSVKDYGFINTQSIVTELLIKLIKEVEIKLNAKGLRYRSTRILETNVVSKAIKVACDNYFKDPSGTRQPIKMPTNTDKTAVYLASQVGTKGGINRTMNPATLREIFNDPNCRAFISIIQDIIERIKIIAIIIPFYEADIIRAISYPYFDKEEELICDWNKIQKRSETADEALVAEAKVTEKEKIATLIAKGVNIKSAIKAVIKESKK